MCIAIHKPKGREIPVPYLEESFRSNPDGAGFVAYHHAAGGFIIRKGFFDFAEFLAAYHAYRFCEALVHFRIATHGEINAEMCHPFPLCGGEYAMIHNGVLDIKPHKGKSDTATFADSVLTPILDYGLPIDSPALKFLVESAIGRWNKMLIMDRQGKVVSFNEKSGHTENGIWYSNYSYLPVVSKPVTTPTPWDLARWESAGFSRRGTILNEPRLCLYCEDPLDQFAYDDEELCEVCAAELREYESLK